MSGPLVESIHFCSAQSHFHWGLNRVERTSQFSQMSWTVLTTSATHASPTIPQPSRRTSAPSVT